MKLKTALTIAGSDCSGGAGIQADLKTMTMNGVYGMSAITALTAQNTTGVTAISEVTPAFLKQQIDMIFDDIRPDAVKIGMVSSAALIEVIAERLRHYQAVNIVVDPVMVATSGSALMENDAVATLKKSLLPMATVITPNIPEAQVLSGTICCTTAMGRSGSTASASPTPTPTAPDAPSLRPSLPIWPKAILWRIPSGGPRITCLVLWPPCWTWAMAAVPCTTDLTCGEPLQSAWNKIGLNV